MLQVKNQYVHHYVEMELFQELKSAMMEIILLEMDVAAVRLIDFLVVQVNHLFVLINVEIAYLNHSSNKTATMVTVQSTMVVSITAQLIHNGLVSIPMDKLQFVPLFVEMELLLEMKNVMMETIWQMTDVFHVKSKLFTAVQDNHQYVLALAEMEFSNKNSTKSVMMEIPLKMMDV